MRPVTAAALRRPGRKRGPKPEARRLGDAHVGAHRDVHSHEARGGARQRTQGEAGRGPPSEEQARRTRKMGTPTTATVRYCRLRNAWRPVRIASAISTGARVLWRRRQDQNGRGRHRSCDQGQQRGNRGQSQSWALLPPGRPNPRQGAGGSRASGSTRSRCPRFRIAGARSDASFGGGPAGGTGN